MSDYKIPADTGSGVMFWNNDKRSEKAPDMSGKITLDIELVRSLVGMAKRGEPLVLDVSGWQRKSHKGTDMLTMSIKKVFKPGSGGADYRNVTPRQPVARSAPPKADDLGEDEIPF